MKKVEDYIAIAKAYNKLKTDLQRLEFLKQNNTMLKAVLDNDQTNGEFIFPKEMDDVISDSLQLTDLNSFDDYHYWSNGCLLLFQFAGITAESC